MVLSQVQLVCLLGGDKQGHRAEILGVNLVVRGGVYLLIDGQDLDVFEQAL